MSRRRRSAARLWQMTLCTAVARVMALQPQDPFVTIFRESEPRFWSGRRLSAWPRSGELILSDSEMAVDASGGNALVSGARQQNETTGRAESLNDLDWTRFPMLQKLIDRQFTDADHSA
jgi:hypothetical protein